MQIDQEQYQLAQQQAMLEQSVKQRFSKEALTRFGNIKVAHPEKAMQVVLMFAKLIADNDVEVIDDEHLKELLRRLSEKREIKIKRR